jgi:2-dehydropantoate 2-reductase
VSDVTIVGAGGIGCALGHALRLGGVEVVFVESDEAKLEWGPANGVAVDDSRPIPATFVHFDDWNPSTDDLLLLCTKCYDNADVLARVPNAAGVIPVQNGFDTLLADRVEVEGIASFVSECTPGRTHTRITRPGDLHIGFRDTANGRTIPERIAGLIDILDDHGRFTVRRVEAVLPYKYSKLMYNAAISPVAAMAGLDNGELLTVPTARKVFFGLIRENYRILKLAGAPLAKIGPFHPDTVDRILRFPPVARLLAVRFERTLRGTYCSMAGELQTGRSEMDHYNGHLLELAGDLDVSLNRRVFAAAKRMEADRAEPGLDWLDRLCAPTSGNDHDAS